MGMMETPMETTSFRAHNIGLPMLLPSPDLDAQGLFLCAADHGLCWPQIHSGVPK